MYELTRVVTCRARVGREGWEGGGGISFEVMRISGEEEGWEGVGVDMMVMCGVGCEREGRCQHAIILRAKSLEKRCDFSEQNTHLNRTYIARVKFCDSTYRCG